ncbi:MAG: ABC transporter permease [Theionarchaea archaeon]|nr:ABC transporter permease [Theionarchaea archaeon]
MSIKERVFGMTLKSVFRRRMRSGLTIAGIAIGIMLVTALLLVADGLETQFTRVVEEGGGDFIVVERDASDLMMSRVDLSAKRELEKMDEISWVSGMAITVTKILDRPYFMVFGVDPGEPVIQHFEIVEGQQLTSNDTGKIMVGRMISVQKGLQVGDTLNMKGSTFEILGIYETGASFEDAGGVILLSEAQSLFGLGNQVSMLRVKLEDVNKVDAVRTKIEKQYPQLLAMRSSEVVAQQEDLQLIAGISALISLIAIVVGSIGIMNTMVMSVMERIREIGILRAVGWKRRSILSMVLKESLCISIIGGIIGIILGILIVNNLAAEIEIPLTVSITPDLVISAFIIAVILGILGGIYPAWRASKMSPMEALSHE